MLPKVPDGQLYWQPVKLDGGRERGAGGMYVPRLQRKGIALWMETMMPVLQVTEPTRNVLLKSSEEEEFTPVKISSAQLLPLRDDITWNNSSWLLEKVFESSVSEPPFALMPPPCETRAIQTASRRTDVPHR